MKQKSDYLFRLLIIIIFTLLSVTSIIFSLYLFFISKNNFDLIVLSSIFLVLSLISTIFNVIMGLFYYRSYFYGNYLKKIKNEFKFNKNNLPKVSVVLLAYNEDPKLIIKNYNELLKITYPKNKINFFLSDDSTMPEIRSELKNFCNTSNIFYIHRKENKDYKAGALNNFIKHSKDELILIFDYDEYLIDKNILLDLVPLFNDKNVSFVQTEKRYFDGNIFSDSVDLFDAFFFKFIEPARALNNTAIFAGSCGIIRRSALDKIGGFPKNVIEDTFFSFESDLHKYKGIFIPKIYAKGKPITKFSALAKQQIRYNYGDTQFLKYVLEKSKRSELTFKSKLDYISHGFGLNYLSVMLLLFTILSIFIVFLIPFIKIPITELFNPNFINYKFELFGIFGFLIALVFPILLTKIYFKSIKKGIMIFILNFALIIIRTKAAVYALFNKNIDLWSRRTLITKKSIVQSISLTKMELLFSSILFSLGYFAILKSIIFGGIFLIWYGFMYISATVLFYKYG